MKKHQLLITLVLIVSISANGQSFQWAAQSGSINSERAYAIDVDDSNNVLTTGFFNNKVLERYSYCSIDEGVRLPFVLI